MNEARFHLPQYPQETFVQIAQVNNERNFLRTNGFSTCSWSISVYSTSSRWSSYPPSSLLPVYTTLVIGLQKYDYSISKLDAFVSPTFRNEWCFSYSRLKKIVTLK